MAQVDLENVTKVYGGQVRAVDRLSLSIAKGEFIVLVGPSGCGKSTTLRMIAGLEEITSGQIRIGGRVVNDVPPQHRDVAMVFQNYALYPHMSVYKNLAFGLKMRGVGRDEIRRRVTEAAAMLDIGELLGRKPRQLSGGQRQRVAVGRAIVRQPAAFLLDEPLSNLDARLRVTTRFQLKQLHQRLRTTTIYVTHDQEEAMTLGDRIVVMKDGRVQQADRPQATYNDPLNRFVAGFIGMPPMNFFDGAIMIEDGRLAFEEGKLDNGGNWAARGQELRIPAPATLAGRVGHKVVLGIRPQHLSFASGDQINWAPARMTVNVIEPLGHETDIYMSTNLNDHVVARVAASGQRSLPEGLSIGAQVTVWLDLRKVCFFEPGETGMNLSLKSEPAHAVA